MRCDTLRRAVVVGLVGAWSPAAAAQDRSREHLARIAILILSILSR
jgi:hypothetical protein